MVWEEGVGGMVLWEEGVGGMVLWEEGVMGDGVVGGGCWGMVLWEEGVGGMVLWEEGVMGDGVVGMVLWTTLQNQLTFSDLTFGDYFLLCPLSPISYLNSMYMYMCTSPSSPLAPSDALVVMATSSSITVTGGLSSPARGPQTTIFNVQAPLQTVVTGLQPVTTYLVYIYIHVAASTVGTNWQKREGGGRSEQA